MGLSGMNAYLYDILGNCYAVPIEHVTYVPPEIGMTEWPAHEEDAGLEEIVPEVAEFDSGHLAYMKHRRETQEIGGPEDG